MRCERCGAEAYAVAVECHPNCDCIECVAEFDDPQWFNSDEYIEWFYDRMTPAEAEAFEAFLDLP